MEVVAEIPSTTAEPLAGAGIRPHPGRTLSNRTIALCGVLMVAIATVACWVLLTLYGHGTDADRARLDGIRTVGTIVVGTGGALALVLAARRQQTPSTIWRPSARNCGSGNRPTGPRGTTPPNAGSTSST
ncbi:hypothetical protein [Amycolatopsis sp. NPDC051372]|uniref:hypothetical protein n=1 Tax=Amycolatopsis sp. NPDC051372 TaxID=3155669 RepID=UPI0034301712